MKLLLVRHAPAGDRLAWIAAGKDDFLRPLVPEGRRRMREAARGLARLVDPPAALATSPLVRAVETADVLARALDVPAAEELDALRPGSPARALLPWLREHRDDELVAAVGHEPHLGGLASWLLAGRARPFVALKKGGACLLDLGGSPREGGAVLVWAMQPGQLRRVGR
jgi:phosphohistidine phosphatase